MANACELRAAGRIYGGWKDIEIQRGLEQLAGTFSLQVTERWPGQPAPRPIRCGEPVTVTIDGEPVVTGYVEGARPGFDAKNTWYGVSGRDRTGDLIDCSAVFKSGQWKGASLARIAVDLVAPFGIAVVVGERARSRADKAIGSFRLEEGETVFDALDRAARLAAVMVWTDGLGRVVIDLPGARRAETALVEGDNILRVDAELSWAERFSDYIVKGQARGKHDSRGTARDPVVPRYRPLVILAEDEADGVTAQQRADWERTVRQGRANRATIRVQSWRQGGDAGALWAPGLRVPVTSPTLRLDAEMLIASVTYLKNEQDGTVCELEIADPRAFDLLTGARGAALGASSKDGRKRLGRSQANRDAGPLDWSAR